MHIGHRFLRFLVTGGIGFLVDGGILLLLHYGLSIDATLSRCISIPIAISCTWWVNRNYTFRDKKSTQHLREYLKYIIANSVGALINLVIYLTLLASQAPYISEPFKAFVIASAVALSFNFLINHFRVFNES